MQRTPLCRFGAPRDALSDSFGTCGQPAAPDADAAAAAKIGAAAGSRGAVTAAAAADQQQSHRVRSPLPGDNQRQHIDSENCPQQRAAGAGGHAEGESRLGRKQSLR